MKIGVEAKAITRENRTGIDNYTYELLSAMAQERPRYSFFLTYFRFFPFPAPRIGMEQGNVREVRNSWMPAKAYDGFYRYLRAPPLDMMMKCACDFYLFPNFVRWPLAYSARSGVVVYDLSFIHSYSTMTTRLRKFLSRKVPVSIERSDCVFTISDNSKREIIAEYGTKPEKIVVARPGIDRTVFYPREEKECAPFLSTYRLGWKGYILFVGTVEPRKNILGLLNAYAILRKNIRRHYPLVITGGKGWLDAGILAQIESLRAKGCTIITTGYLSSEKLPMILSAAKVFVFPSLYEGFGMPPLEAMACGTPVVTSDSSSLPEVVGDAAIMVAPYDHAALSHAIERVIDDQEMAGAMREAGMKQAKRFQWQESARLVLRTIEGVVR